MSMKGREQKRLQKELDDMRAKNSQGGPVTADALIPDNINIWEGRILGPEESPYAKGVFLIEINIPEEYPYTPPKMKFKTKIWHPNISSQTGAICLDVLGKEWSPALSIRTALLSIQAMLSDPEPDDPQDAEVAGMYKNQPELFKETATKWCEMYAQEGSPEQVQKIGMITEMGFTEEQAKNALKACNWNEQEALNQLLG